jgi:hypothetical protein
LVGLIDADVNGIPSVQVQRIGDLRDGDPGLSSQHDSFCVLGSVSLEEPSLVSLDP